MSEFSGRRQGPGAWAPHDAGRCAQGLLVTRAMRSDVCIARRRETQIATRPARSGATRTSRYVGALLGALIIMRFVNPPPPLVDTASAAGFFELSMEKRPPFDGCCFTATGESSASRLCAPSVALLWLV